MSTTSFRQRIRESINNETLQIALDNNSERRLKGRALAFESIPDWRERRQRAHAVRADVIDHLDEYLAQFIAKNEENGVIVHRAKDAAEAIRIVLEIQIYASAETQDTVMHVIAVACVKVLIAKSKSMVSEEIELNHALEEENIKVVETDLGEYIVQLRHERPSHIITPAAHLRKEQVAQLFHEKLGIPYTEDIPTLTATARKIMREVFLTADIGISGVNFGVAETGSLCVVSNEGNARMVATIPPVHIALMGMERLVPNLDDLSLLISLLARSATGQKISVYTQILTKPLANQQRHLIILDNGRSRVRNSPLKESLLCIRCGACLNACPVFRELGGHAYIGSDLSIAPYPGPIGSVISPGLLGENYVQLAQASSLCGACKDACPVDIDLPKLLTRVRAGQSPTIDNETHRPQELDYRSRQNLVCRCTPASRLTRGCMRRHKNLRRLEVFSSPPSRSGFVCPHLQAGDTARTCRSLQGRHFGNGFWSPTACCQEHQDIRYLHRNNVQEHTHCSTSSCTP